MTIQEYRRIMAEQTALRNLLDRLPSSSVIERRGLEFGKRKVDRILASRPPVLKEPAHVPLTVRGKPVVGSWQQMTGRFPGNLASQSAV